MKSCDSRLRQRGVALVVALLFLLVVTVISVIAASNSALGLKMSANMADSYDSFQSAEAGIVAALALAETANDPFDGDDTPDPFAAFNNANHPLRALNDGSASVDVDIFITNAATACPGVLPGPASACSTAIFTVLRRSTRSRRPAPGWTWAW